MEFLVLVCTFDRSVLAPQASADGRGEQRAEVLRSLSSSKHRETRGGDDIIVTLFCLFSFVLLS